MLQTVIARDPAQFSGWVKMANLVALGAQDRHGLAVAQGCIAIALRLIRCGGIAAAHEMNWNTELRDFRKGFEMHGVVLEPTASTLRRMERTALANEAGIYNVIRNAMTSQSPTADRILPEAKVKDLVDILFRRCA
eukprot:TRINITY_DN65125_c0_g1_i1.p1 TRINITY_DN65125_c0_g1~~TRINITY_DN65125_c0_g1_i1.p1  ORF type:complete len:152 (+),score=20.35 TRINITY_DN65125_c0_g1_i1:50-457(+)